MFAWMYAIGRFERARLGRRRDQRPRGDDVWQLATLDRLADRSGRDLRAELL